MITDQYSKWFSEVWSPSEPVWLPEHWITWVKTLNYQSCPVNFELPRYSPTQSGSTVSYEVPPLGLVRRNVWMGVCVCVCMLSLGTCTQVCTLTKVHEVNLWWGTKLLSVTTDTVSWTEVLKCATIPRHCRDVWTVCCWLTDQSDQASLSNHLAKSLGKLVLGTCVLTVISNNLVT